ncbi:MAG: hypothetical protein ACTS8P_02750 [Arsenophonus sp. NC-XBC3-MAG3]
MENNCYGLQVETNRQGNNEDIVAGWIRTPSKQQCLSAAFGTITNEFM